MITKEKHTQQFRFYCDICTYKSRRYPSRPSAEMAERNHLISRHEGAEVFVEKEAGSDEDDLWNTEEFMVMMEHHADP